MNEEVVKNFAFSYFQGLKNVYFSKFGEERIMTFEFVDEECFHLGLGKLRKDNVLDMFWVDDEKLILTCDRDNYETAMYMTAAQMAMNGWLAEFSRKVDIEREVMKHLEEIEED